MLYNQIENMVWWDMKNKKGFVLTETLVVTVFLVTIFTFIYVSIIPLMGKYEDLVNREKDIDIVYKLYNIRKLLMNVDSNLVTKEGFNDDITCDIFSNMSYRTYCDKLFEQMEITNYKLIYVDNIHNNIENGNIGRVDLSLNTNADEFYQYLKAYERDDGQYLVILDMSRDVYSGNERHTMAHLLFSPYVYVN